ncbi:MAG: hypothetical protein ACF8GE_09860 [Phycisphaerales bacterium JB043]
MSTRRAITLVECVASIALLAAALPPTLSLLHDATDARTEAMQVERATWYATALLESIAADVGSASAGLGFEALDNDSTYINDASSGLLVRTQDIGNLYGGTDLSATVDISAKVSADGTATGDTNLDVFRMATVTISWPRHDGTGSLALSRLVSDYE